MKKKYSKEKIIYRNNSIDNKYKEYTKNKIKKLCENNNIEYLKEDKYLTKHELERNDKNMMISPNSYREEHKNLSLIELIDKRNELIKSLNNYENNNIKNENGNNLEVVMSPSPATRYHWYNEYLKEITDLILEKMREEQVKKLK